MWKPKTALPMSLSDRDTLEAWVRAGTTPQRLAQRARICLLAADGVSNNGIAKRLGVSRPTVILWRDRFSADGPISLTKDAPRGPSSKRLDAAKVAAIVEATLHARPPDAARWSTRSMARAHGVSRSTVARIWKAHGLQPHRK